MKTRLLVVTLITASALAQQPAPPATPPATPPPAQANPAPTEPPKRKKFNYAPPKDNLVGKRLDGDGGSRGQLKLPDGTTITLPDIFVLAPKHVAYTTQAQPTLLTFQTDHCAVKYIATLTEVGQPAPIFRLEASRIASGFFRINLADYDISLKPGMTYEWKVALRPDPNAPSQDLFASALVKRIEPGKELAEKLKTATPDDLPSIYAEAGIWYDALAAVSERVLVNPTDKEWQSTRMALLSQGELTKVTDLSGRGKGGR